MPNEPTLDIEQLMTALPDWPWAERQHALFGAPTAVTLLFATAFYDELPWERLAAALLRTVHLQHFNRLIGRYDRAYEVLLAQSRTDPNASPPRHEQDLSVLYKHRTEFIAMTFATLYRRQMSIGTPTTE